MANFDGSAAVVHVGADDPVAMTIPLGDGTAKQYVVERDASGQAVRLRGLRRFAIADPTQVDEARFTAEGRPESVRLASGAQVRFRYVADQVLLAVALPDGRTVTTLFAYTPPVRAGGASVGVASVSGPALGARGTAAPRTAPLPSGLLGASPSLSSMGWLAAASAAAGPATGSILVTGPDGPVRDAAVEVESRRAGPAFDFYRPAATAAAGGGRYTFAVPTEVAKWQESEVGARCARAEALVQDACTFLGPTDALGTEFLTAMRAGCTAIAAIPVPYAPVAVAGCLAAVVTIGVTCHPVVAATGCAAVGRAYDWALAPLASRTFRGWVRRGACLSMIPNWDVSGVVSGATLAPVTVTTSCPPDVAVDVALSSTTTAVAGSPGTLLFTAVASTSGSSEVPIGSITISGPFGMGPCTPAGVGTLTVAMVACRTGIPSTAGTFTYTAVAVAAGARVTATTTVRVTPDPSMLVDSTRFYTAAVQGDWAWTATQLGSTLVTEVTFKPDGFAVWRYASTGCGPQIGAGYPPYFPPVVGGYCHYQGPWSIKTTTLGGKRRYYLSASGYFRAGTVVDAIVEPLTMPLTSFSVKQAPSGLLEHTYTRR